MNSLFACRRSLRPAPARAAQARRSIRAAIALAACALGIVGGAAFAEERFPPPEFESGYTFPPTDAQIHPAGAPAWTFIDIAALAAALSLAAWLVLKRRSRRAVLALGAASVLYFGLWREGCVCAIGSIQNVALALADASYAVPISALAFFLLPLIAAAFVGRAFCAAVCPHGALQDLVLLHPVRVPAWLDQALRLLPYIYLGAGVFFAATGSAFLICEYDPFVPFFRRTGGLGVFLLGGGLLALGLFIGRPYCRYLCPYGALLGMVSTVSRRRVTITPDICTQCRLCETACPYGAIRTPSDGIPAEHRPAMRRRLALLLALAPLIVAAGVWSFGRLAGPAARMHPAVRLSDLLRLEEAGKSPTDPVTADTLAAFRATGRPPDEAHAEAAAVLRRAARGAQVLGALLGLVFAVKLASLSVGRRRKDYEADRGTCVACARCFESCPQEQIRLGRITPAPAVGAGSRPPARAPDEPIPV
jgi:NAD-dependent dihydropyrimidine dehydrogenase PreA subunit